MRRQAREKKRINERMSYLKDKSTSRFLRTVLIAKEKFSHLLLESDAVNEGNYKNKPLSHRMQNTNANSTKSNSVSNAAMIQNQANYLSKLSSPKTKLSSVNSSSIISTYPGKYPNVDSIQEKNNSNYLSPKGQT